MRQVYNPVIYVIDIMRCLPGVRAGWQRCLPCWEIFYELKILHLFDLLYTLVLSILPPGFPPARE